MKNYNEIFIKNIEILRLENNIKMGDLEKKLGVSSGYFSRLAKNTEHLPGVDILVKLSSMFNYSIDTLISVYLDDLGADERKILSFLRQVRNKTANGLLEWKKQENNLLQFVEVGIEDGGMFRHPYDVKTNGSSIFAKINENIELEIMPISLSKKNNKFFGFDLFLKKNGNKIPFCSTVMVHPIIIQNINDLVSIALKSCNCYRLLDEARCIVDDLIEE